MCKGGCKLIFLLATGILFSCGSKNSEKKFFDVPGYFKKEVDSLSKVDFNFRKIAVYNGDTNKIEVNSKDINWKKELGIFLESDINKPSYYTHLIPIDLTDSNCKRVVYKSDSDKLAIVEVDIIWGFMDREVKVLSIKINKNNLISSTQMLAVYVRGSRYFISGVQKIKNLGSTNQFFIEGQFQNF
jgi:hypothetical protein